MRNTTRLSRRAARSGLAVLLLATVAATAVASSYTTPEASQVTGLDGWTPKPLFTVGEVVDGYRPPGILDGLGAQKLNKNVVRIYANHELGRTAGYVYSLANGLQLRGARISFFDVDRTTRDLCDAGLAYDRVYDRYGLPVTAATQINEGASLVDGFARFCSSTFYDKGAYGFADDIYITGEENDNGSQWALDVKNRTIWACPALGRGAWENVSAIDAGCKDRIALLLGDDEEAAPLYLWVGIKKKTGNFIERNGLSEGQLYVWAANDGSLDPEDWNTVGSSRAGKFLPIDARDPAKAGLPGHDAQGYKNDVTLRTEADLMGAFSFSRPEDIHTNPRCDTEAVFASTGRGALYPSDDWGTLYLIDVDFERCKCRKNSDLPADVPGTLEILYNARTLPVPDEGIRNPDNLVWAEDGYIYVNEDRSTQLNVFGGVSGREASVWRIDPDDASTVRIGEINRAAVVPAGGGVTDPAPLDIGNWETSGVIDVTKLFPRAKGERLLLLDVQAHNLTNGVIGGSANLVQGGQLLLFSKKSAKNRGDDCECKDRDDD
jgi:hypothetical protein